MKQTSRFDGLLFDPFSSLLDGFTSPEVDFSGYEALQALMTEPMVVVLDEGVNQLPEIARQLVIFQQDAVLERLVLALDLSLSLPMVRRPWKMIYLLLFPPIGQFTKDLNGAIARHYCRTDDGREFRKLNIIDE